MVAWGALASLGVGLLSAGSSFATSKQSYKYTRRLQDAQNAWMERMSNTAHQREVKDLKAAGLNPILSANGGASTPSAGSATFTSNDSINSGLQAAMQFKQLKQADRQADIQDRSVDNDSRRVRIAEHMEPYQQTQIQSAIDASIAQAKVQTATAKQIEEQTKWIGREAMSRIQANNASAYSSYQSGLSSAVSAKAVGREYKIQSEWDKRHPILRGVATGVRRFGIGGNLGASFSGSFKH